MAAGQATCTPLPPPTSFVGRSADVAAVEALLRSHHLVTIAGAGGAGKSRLALEVASRRAGAGDADTRFVDLAPVEEGHAAAAAIEAAAEERTGAVLLIVDNCEHVALDVAAALVRVLADPSASVLATSRSRLGLGAEVVHHLFGLPAAEAAQLFCERARLVGVHQDPGPGVEAVCERLDRLPLAIELAAARARTFTPPELARHLDDVPLLTETPAPGRPARHQTLRAAVSWSHSLLSAEDRRAFRRLGVFAGWFDRDHAVAMLTAGRVDLGRVAASDALDRLVEGSLVQAVKAGSTTTFRLPFAIRGLAREQLEESCDEIPVRRWLLGRMDEMALRVEQEGSYSAAAFEQIDAFADDLRSTLAWLLATGSGADLLRLTGSLYHYWQVRGQLREGRRWLTAALAHDDGGDPAATVRVHNGLGNLAQLAGDLAEAREHYQECLAVRRRGGSAAATATALNDLGTCCIAQGDLDGASEALDEALALHMAQENLWGVACTQVNLGVVRRYRGDLDGARELMESAATHFEATGDPLSGLTARANIASIDLSRGRFRDAADAAAEVMASAVTLNALSLLPPILETAAVAAAELGDHAAAARLLGAADARRADQDQPRGSEDAAEIEVVRGRLVDALGPAGARDQMRSGAAAAVPQLGGLAARDGTEAEPNRHSTRPQRVRLANEGDVWAIGPPGSERRFRSTKGLAYLARLLDRPEQEIHVLDLAGSSTDLGGGTGPLLDDTARRALHRRWMELRDDLADAERLCDPERAALAQAALDQLADAVANAVGLRGRDRVPGDAAERARKAVTNRLRDAVRRIGAVDPVLGRHLDTAVRTGTYCVYLPDRPLEWVIES